MDCQIEIWNPQEMPSVVELHEMGNALGMSTFQDDFGPHLRGLIRKSVSPYEIFGVVTRFN